MDNGNLIIEGKRDTKAEQNKDNFRMVERNYGGFYRSLYLADAAEAKGIKAHCHNGVLEVKVPLAEAAQHKKIEVIVD
jgi:HSP20 family protein